MKKELFDKVINSLNNLDEVKHNKIYGDEAIADATKMAENGWDKLEDGIVVLVKENLVATKKGNTIVKSEMKDFNVNMGKLSGNVAKELGIIKVTDDKKETYLAQTIITKYYTIRRF